MSELSNTKDLLSMNHQKIEDMINFNNPDFVDNFNKLIEDSHLRYLEKVKLDPEYPNKEEIKQDNKLRKKAVLENIFKEQKPWIPPFVYGKEFDKLKILKHEKNMNDWEIVRFILNFIFSTEIILVKDLILRRNKI